MIQKLNHKDKIRVLNNVAQACKYPKDSKNNTNIESELRSHNT